MSIGFRNFTSTDAHAPSTVTVVKPTGNAAGDILIVVMGIGCAGAAISAPTAPAGWTSIGSVANATTGGNRVSIYAWWALGSVAALGFTVPTDHVYDVGTVTLGFTGVDNTTPIDATGTANSATGAATITTNAVTPATTGAIHVVPLASWVGGTWSLSGFTLKQNAGSNEDASCAYSLTGLTSGVSTGTKVFTTTGGSSGQILAAVPFALRPAASGSPYTLAVGQGSYALTGQTVALRATRLLTVGQGSYTLTGQAVVLRRGYPLAVGAATFTLGGQAVALRATRTLTAAVGSFSLAGQAVALRATRLLAVGAGTFTLSGQAVTLTKTGSYAIAVGLGSFSLAGQAVALRAARTMAAGSGTYSLAGQAVGLRGARVLGVGVGSFALTGKAVTLTYSGAATATSAWLYRYTQFWLRRRR